MVGCLMTQAIFEAEPNHLKVMCANKDGVVEILAPPAGAVPGDVIEIEGYPRLSFWCSPMFDLFQIMTTGNPDVELNPKKKIFEAVQA